MVNKKQLFGLNLLCAVAYFFGAYAGGLFALPPAGASPIWPAAGVALTLLLLCGNKVLPGLFLGALCAQTFSFLDASSTETLTNSLLTGTIIGLGSCLQAILATWLITRFVGANDLLIKDAHIIRFLLLGGPVSCVVTASFSSVFLSYTSAISLHDLLSNWLTWWIGDTMGVLLFTPLLLIFFARPRDLWQSRRKYVGYPLLMLLILVLALFDYAKHEEELWMQTIFNQQTKLLESAFKHELGLHVAVTTELKSFFDNSEPVTQQEFQNFSKTVIKQHGSVQALEWIPRISDSQRANFEKTGQPPVLIRELTAQGGVVRAGQRDVYFPVTFIEPLLGNERALGFDVATNFLALQALLKAQDTGQTIASVKLKLVQDTKKTQGVVIYAPIYDKSKVLHTRQDRKQALKGFVASVLRIENEVNEVIAQIPDLQLLIKIIDGDTVLYSDFPLNVPHNLNSLNLSKESLIKVADRTWQVIYQPSESFTIRHQSRQRWWLLFGCLLLTSLTGMSLLMLTGRTLRTEELVKIRTRELHHEVSQRENRSRVLHALVMSKPLTEILNLIVKIVEDEDPQILCSILLLTEDKKHLTHGAAGRLPKFYTSAIEGIEIGDSVGSCGTAAFLGQRVIVADINHHPYWEKFLALTQQAGLGACWSEPIISSENKILGTFAIYYPTAKVPNKVELQKIEEFAQLASLAIEKNRAEEKIYQLAFYDPLTQLPNRRLLNDRLTQELAGVDRSQGYGALMFLDLDNFKTLNDTLGHHIGDELLIQVAERLKKCVRDQDTVARLGGDEFVVLQTAILSDNLEQATDCALIIAKRIQTALFISYSLQGYEYHVTASIGITLFGKDNKDIDALFKQADTAMYAAKNKGRNTFSFYNPQI